VDNVVRQGRVADPNVTEDINCEGVRALLNFLKDDPDIEATTIATVGEKGHDGFMYCVRK
jgi:predicted O-methyltransferase YrrM